MSQPKTPTRESLDSLRRRKDYLDLKRRAATLKGRLDRTERSLESMREVLAALPDAVDVVAEDATVVYANPASVRFHGRTSLEGTDYTRVFPGALCAGGEFVHAAAIDSGGAVSARVAKRGRAYDVTARPVHLSDGRRASVCVTRTAESTPGADTQAPGHARAGDTERSDGSADAHIARLTAGTLDAVLQNVPEAVAVFGENGDTVVCNATFRRLVQGAESTFEGAAGVLFGGDRPPKTPAELFQRGLGVSDTRCGDTTVRHPVDGDIPTLYTASRLRPGDGPTGVVLVVQDRRELDRVKNQLMQALNVSVAGERIASLAHQVNNYLTPAFHHADALANAEEFDEKARRSVATLQNYLSLCHESILMVLSIMRPAVPGAIDVNEIIEEALSKHYLADDLRLDNVTVERRLDPDVPITTGYRVLLLQALANVIKNAREAMVEASGGGTLTIETESTPATIWIRIRDDGPGIPEELRDRIFDLLFTSKTGIKGNGIGLHFTRSVVEKHGGSIEVRSDAGGGAEFIVRLPVKSAPELEGHAGRSETDSPRSSPAATNHFEGPDVLGSLLIIDDEPGILELLADVLVRRGHRVTTTDDAREALEWLGTRTFDGVLCDIKMPGMDGREMSEKLKRDHPELYRRLVFITGDIFNDETETFIHDTGVECLEKPFTTEQVHEVVQRALRRAD